MTDDRLTVLPYREGDAQILVHVFFAAVRELARVKYDEDQVRGLPAFLIRQNGKRECV